jgi:polyisoprenoid-binding protein YceI
VRTPAFFAAALRVSMSLGLTTSASVVAADEPGLRIDTAKSLAGFSVRAAWVKRIEGRFAHIEGVVRPEAADRFVLEVRIASGSVLMERSSHEDWARSADFFDAARHPWIEFRAAGLPGALLRTGGPIEGVLTLRGISRPVSFELLPADCAEPGLQCPVQARGEVNRSEFGMTARRVFVSDRVKLSFDVRLRAPEPAPPGLG